MTCRVLFAFLLISIIAEAQPTMAEVKKYKIKKAVEKRTDDGGTAEKFWYYDRKGYDSLQSYFDETLQVKNTFRNGKLVKKRLLSTGNNASSKEDVYTYEYKPDGSYKVTFTDGNFSMKSYQWFDKKGKLLKSQSPDGNTITYNYDAKGKLISIVSDGYNQGIKINHKNTYNAKGQLIRQERNTDGEKMTITYSYDAKGLLSKEIVTGEQGSGIPTTTTVYEHNNKGLPVKKISTSIDAETGSPVMVTYAFEYEYY